MRHVMATAGYPSNEREQFAAGAATNVDVGDLPRLNCAAAVSDFRQPTTLMTSTGPSSLPVVMRRNSLDGSAIPIFNIADDAICFSSSEMVGASFEAAHIFSRHDRPLVERLTSATGGQVSPFMWNQRDFSCGFSTSPMANVTDVDGPNCRLRLSSAAEYYYPPAAGRQIEPLPNSVTVTPSAYFQRPVLSFVDIPSGCLSPPASYDGSNDGFQKCTDANRSAVSATNNASLILDYSNVACVRDDSWLWSADSSSSSSSSATTTTSKSCLSAAGPCRRSTRLTAAAASVEHGRSHSSSSSIASGFFFSRKRTSFSDDQLNYLIGLFEAKPYIDAAERSRVAACLGLTETQVKVWFQNRRSKYNRTTKRERGNNSTAYMMMVPTNISVQTSGECVSSPYDHDAEMNAESHGERSAVHRVSSQSSG